MEVLISKLIKEMRVAIDEVSHDEMNDIFVDDSDEEMAHAIETASQQILLQAPQEMLVPQIVKPSIGTDGTFDYDAIQTQYTDGHGSLVIPDDWLRLVVLKLRSWQGSLRTLMEPGSKEAQMQSSMWTRGTPQKPKGMISVSPITGKKVLVYWTAGRYDTQETPSLKSVYDHQVEIFTYIPYQKIVDVTPSGEAEISLNDKKLILPLVDEARKFIVYRAVSVFLISKKESDLADRFNQLSQV